MIQANSVGVLDQRESSEGGEKRIGAKYILRVEPAGFAER